jgi:hypothetical protein
MSSPKTIEVHGTIVLLSIDTGDMLQKYAILIFFIIWYLYIITISNISRKELRPMTSNFFCFGEIPHYFDLILTHVYRGVLWKQWPQFARFPQQFPIGNRNIKRFLRFSTFTSSLDSQIWPNLHVDDYRFGNITKLKKTPANNPIWTGLYKDILLKTWLQDVPIVRKKKLTFPRI